MPTTLERETTQSKLQSHLSVISTLPVILLLSSLRLYFVYVQASINYFILLYIIESLLILIGSIVVYLWSGSGFADWRFDRTVVGRFLRAGVPLMVSGLAISLYMTVDKLIIKQMLDIQALGLYSAAARISEMWYFVPGSISSSFLPILAKKRINRAHYEMLMVKYFRLMFLISVVFGLLVSVFAPQIISIFGIEYAAASDILRVHIWAGLPVAMGVSSSSYLLIENLTSVSLYRTLFGAVVNVILNFILLPRVGVIGAAYATLLAYFCAGFMVL